VSNIHLLDELTANQIAAGEVIERPASVIKELVENSLDAEAKKIVVEIVDGGLKELKVIDDGCGMSKENVSLAIKRHATSKINTIADLNRLQSLGFRGEALPSITSVAKVEILTREPQVNYGTKLTIAGNKHLSLESVGTSVGTTIIVTDLFFNTPARKKFLRSARYESSLIYEVLMQFSLSHPQVDFRLLRDGKENLNTTGIKTHPDLLEYYYGSNVKEALIEIEGKLSDGIISGYLTLPTCHRTNRRGINFFINQRRVYSQELLNALDKAYENVLPKGQFPLCVLNLTLDPATIDVNVHPSKLEVRLRNPLLAKEMTSLLQENLIKKQKIPRYFLDPQKFSLTNTSKLKEDDLSKKNSSYQIQSKGIQEVFQEFYSWESSPQDDFKNLSAVPEQRERSMDLKSCQVIGQLAQTFILAEGKEGLYIIDQHIAQERVIFEDLLKKSTTGSLESQVLLHPVTLHLTLLEEEVMIKYILPLADLGIILENFGPRSYLLRAIPAGVREEPKDFFYSLLEHLEKSKGKTDVLDVKKEFLIHSSCKMAIKAKTKLTFQEMEQLIHDLSTTENFLTCPHGRPIIYKITYSQILKAFHRV
jgi:DNA mismatch repair protein MutL